MPLVSLPICCLLLGQLPPLPLSPPASPAASLSPTLGQPTPAEGPRPSDAQAGQSSGSLQESAATRPPLLPLPLGEGRGEGPLAAPPTPLQSPAAPSSSPSGPAIDRAVVPAAAQAPLVPVDVSARASLSTELLRAALQPVEGQPRLAGQPITLRAALQQAAGSTSRVELVLTYWRLFDAVSAYQLAQREAAVLAQVASGAPAQDEAVLRAAASSAQARVQRLHVRAVQMQQQLSQALGKLSSEPLPLPADLPCARRYLTRLDEAYQGRPVPVRMRHAEQILPLMLGDVQAQALAVRSCTDALAETRQAYQQGQVSPTTLLAAVTQLRQQQSEFLAGVQQYNRKIATYALEVSGSTQTSEVIAAMLIGSAPHTQSVLVPNSAHPVQPASGLQGVPGTIGPASRGGDGFRPRQLREPAASEPAPGSLPLEPSVPKP